MKMAKVSPVYEGKLGKRGREGDEEWRSRMARIDARARMRNFRTNYPRAPPLPVPSQPWTTTFITTGASSSMASSSGENFKEEEEEENQEIFINETGNQDDDDVVIDVEEWTKEVIKIEDDDENEAKQIIINVDDEKEETEEQKTVTETAAAEVPEYRVGCNGWFVGLEEWPMTWSYEEDWMWWGRAPLGLGSGNRGWEYISGVGWIENPPS
ncbi:hypothetical protein Patl1_21457 [Pistacia atlantica]|uniref:Uncharacterized protein n=1 Tax=Pistacia atlantica TaxID=434234 RepID=A0ACC1BJ83_9ROSI|nr:hypothetical protein Patl1_21457 [Pistacia atlantica]